MEMKKSYSPFGSTPLSVDEVLPDIQTGRAVYPDKDKEADASYMERINQYKHEGFHDVSEGSGGSGGSVDCGYSCSEGWATLTDESVTTAIEGNNTFAVGNFAYSELITADTIKVTFNGAEYICNKQINSFGFDYYGADIGVPLGASVDWSEYPFSVSETPVDDLLGTETAGTYQVKIEVLEETVETSECFRKAVKSVGSGILKLNPLGTPLADIIAMADDGGLIYLPLINESNVFSWHLLTRFADGFTFTPSLPTGATAEVGKNLAGEDEFHISWK